MKLFNLKPPKMKGRVDGHGWPAYLFGRIRTSTAALMVAFVALFWVHQTFEPASATTQEQTPQVVPPGFVPDPDYTWVPRTQVQERPRTMTEVPTTTETTTTTSPTETTTTSPTETTTTSPTSPTETAPSTTVIDPDGPGPLAPLTITPPVIPGLPTIPPPAGPGPGPTTPAPPR